MKRTWVADGVGVTGSIRRRERTSEFLRRACEVKNIWVPYGE
jgi:hypothetical protein